MYVKPDVQLSKPLNVGKILGRKYPDFWKSFQNSANFDNFFLLLIDFWIYLFKKRIFY